MGSSSSTLHLPSAALCTKLSSPHPISNEHCLIFAPTRTPPLLASTLVEPFTTSTHTESPPITAICPSPRRLLLLLMPGPAVLLCACAVLGWACCVLLHCKCKCLLPVVRRYPHGCCPDHTPLGRGTIHRPFLFTRHITALLLPKGPLAMALGPWLGRCPLDHPYPYPYPSLAPPSTHHHAIIIHWAGVLSC